ncbi:MULTISPECIES: CGLD27 family protein [Planktothrix]|uniref:CGLD27 family protein n=1 Tax=Planktothrix mougeotii LEGE 06226 TaxID=1828728 RepID=A0ABR9UBH8_9CYAN|nr:MULTISPECIES: CGLD27 family protein [Planktothrix]MBD2482222.1 CGLD27 family protein [Planktothrix sp. FACHB-1365]MBE9143479.1 CGLD27 family protein [Planktothrix mougeotii LEGE 06226]
MREVSVSVCPVPPEQRPVNEYQELKASWFFSWVMLNWPQYLRKLVWVWFISWVIFCPVAAASFAPSKYPGQLILSAATGASFILTLVVIRLSLGWYYIRSRLLSSKIFYEESGWYDGQTWLKTPEFLLQDQLILTHQVQPILTRLRKTYYGLAGLFAGGGLIWILL